MRGRYFDPRRADALDPLGRVAHPAAASHVVVEPRIAVNEDVDAGTVLARDVASEAIEMLLAIRLLRESLRQRHAAQVCGVPAGPRQRAGGGRQQRLAFGGGEHRAPSAVALRQ
jgi:hypothetical protein